MRELARLGQRRPRHAGELLVHAEVVLEGDGRQRLVLRLDVDTFLGLDGLMETFAPPATLEDAARELVDDLRLAVLDDVVDVPLEELLRAERGLELMDEVLVDVLVEVVDVECLLDAANAVLGRHDRALRLVDLVVAVALEALHDPGEPVVELLRVVGPARDDQRRAGLVDEDRVDLVDDGEEVAALRLLVLRQGHVVAEVVEPELVVRAVGDVGLVRGPLRLGVVDLGNDDADLHPEEAVDLPHPVGVAPGEVVVHGHEVAAVAGQRVQVEGQRRDERLALAGLHLGDPAEVECGATHDLDIEVALAERALGRLPHRSERLGEHVVEHLDALFLRVALRQPAPELVRHRPQRLVGARLHLGPSPA